MMPTKTAAITIRYSGTQIQRGLIDLDDLLTSYEGLRDVTHRASKLLYDDLTIKISASTETKAESYQQVLELVSVLASNAHLPDSINYAFEVTKLLFGEGGVIAKLIEMGHEARNKPGTQLTLNDSGVTVSGNNNTINFTQNVQLLANDPDARKAIKNLTSPARNASIDRIDITTEHSRLSLSSDDANLIAIAGLVAQEEGFSKSEEILTVLKPSFEGDKRYRFRSEALGDFGAIMQDMAFQRRVMNRDRLFGSGDKLLVELYARRYPYSTDYFVTKVIQELPPG